MVRRVTEIANPMSALRELRDLALAIALEVAPIPANGQPRTHEARTFATSTKSSEVDEATEAALTQAIARVRPQDGILGEEGAQSTGASGFTWVLDPIDGTVNYFYGLPQWAISVGIVDANGEPVVGVVHAPALGETYVGARGEGAFLLSGGIRHALTPPPEAPLELALLATGFSYDRKRREQMAAIFADLAPRVRDFRRAGAASLDICAVAAGRINGYYERDLKPWDRVAAAAIAQELGLTVKVSGDPMGHNLTIVAPAALAATLEHELTAFGISD